MFPKWCRAIRRIDKLATSLLRKLTFQHFLAKEVDIGHTEPKSEINSRKGVTLSNEKAQGNGNKIDKSIDAKSGKWKVNLNNGTIKFCHHSK